ncbi:hypothetical protein QR680_008010 [Steinernema hermaphroditum]|uniref:Poly [ADP-ribose] polymerase n=1 Tax=Steinernema hermaphroditum TaxID=289476 RepID=A0AA39IF15_9BILA|nr:hypothetical protein QR680_008010 [Steinernema hermaphroditum]
MADTKTLPYGAEYAKSGRAMCKGCRMSISQGSLRLSFRLPSPFFDGLQDNWYHFDCFWIKLRDEINESSIRGIENLRWEDTERIRGMMTEHVATPSRTPSKVEVKAEYAKSAVGKCFLCLEKVPKGDVKLGLKNSWYHYDCFPKDAANFKGSAKDIKGYHLLNDEDQERLQKTFPTENNENGEPSVKRTRIIEAAATPKRAPEDPKNKRQIKKQSEEMWTLRELFSDLKKAQMHDLLDYNRYHPPRKGGESACLDRLVDMAMFGVPAECEKCGHMGTIIYSTSEHAYRCSGNISEYTKCTFVAKQPKRTAFKMPKALQEDHPDLAKFHKRKTSNRIYPTFFESQTIVDVPSTSSRPSNIYKSSSMREKAPIYVKRGCAVDPDCDDYQQYHVYLDKEDGNRAWQTTLGVADAQSNRNSYYKLQLVQHDKRDKFMLFRSWGRIGTNQGGCKTESYGSDLDSAKAEFVKQFRDKSGNEWGREFVKRAGFMDLLEMEVLHDRSDKGQKLSVENSKSKLHKSIKELIAMLFDVDAMKDCMKEMEIDMEKLPLGKLSRKHILNAYSILTELQNYFEVSGKSVNQDVILDATNRFYTLIPHDTGMEAVVKLDNEIIIKEKTELLDNLLEIQLAYTIIKREEDDELDPIDQSYAKLNAKMEVLDKGTPEFQHILKYVSNTHASTHDTYTLDIKDVYKVHRAGEEERYTSQLHNKKLLWHGSRLTNYVGILTQGLRIAPPEAPVTGYMFGKGIYFADMVSKSANYCHALEKEGLLLLCEVALGNQQEEVHAKMITKLNRGKHSCKGLGLTYPNPKEDFTTEDRVVIPFGRAMTAPPNPKKPLDLLYNEYIVYDVNQVKIKYLVRAKFNPTITLL